MRTARLLRAGVFLGCVAAAVCDAVVLAPTDPSIARLGNWTTPFTTNDIGASLVFSFVGTGLAVQLDTFFSYGESAVVLDGNTTRFDAFLAKPAPITARCAVCVVSGLDAEQVHHVNISLLGPGRSEARGQQWLSMSSITYYTQSLQNTSASPAASAASSGALTMLPKATDDSTGRMRMLMASSIGAICAVLIGAVVVVLAVSRWRILRRRRRDEEVRRMSTAPYPKGASAISITQDPPALAVTVPVPVSPIRETGSTPASPISNSSRTRLIRVAASPARSMSEVQLPRKAVAREPIAPPRVTTQ